MATWRGVDEPLRCYLAGMGLNRHDIDDITQETAARALENGMSGAKLCDLKPWAFVVARRLALDLFRARRRWVGIEEACGPDVAQEIALARVEDRHLLGTVAAKVAVLPTRQRDSFAGVALARTDAERNRATVARHRARRRLRHLVGPLAAVVAWSRRHGGHGVAVGGALAAAVLPLVVMSVHHHRHSDESATLRPLGTARGVLVSAPAASQRRQQSLSHFPPRHKPRHSAIKTPRSPGSTERTVVVAKGPAGTWATVAQHQPNGHEPLLCVDPSDLPEPICVGNPLNSAGTARVPTTAR